MRFTSWRIMAGLLLSVYLPLSTANSDFQDYLPGKLDTYLTASVETQNTPLHTPLKRRFTVTLLDYATPCKSPLSVVTTPSGDVQELLSSGNPTQCIRVKSEGGKTTTLYVSESIARYLPSEIPLESRFTVFSEVVFNQTPAPAIIVQQFQAETVQDGDSILKNWIEMGSSQVGQYSLRAVEGNNHFKSSFVRDEDGNYQWLMRVDYPQPKNKVVAYTVIHAYINCEKNRLTYRQAVEFNTDDKVHEILGSHKAPMRAIPVTPNSMAERIVLFVCENRLD